MNKERLKVAFGTGVGLGSIAAALVVRNKYSTLCSARTDDVPRPRVKPVDIDVAYYDEQGKRATRESDERFESPHRHFDYDNRAYDYTVYYHGVEKNENFLQQENAAREFWKDLGFEELPEVYLIENEPKDHINIRQKPTTIACYHSLLNIIVMREERVSELQDAGDRLVVAKALVHEFAHATNPQKYLGVRAIKGEEFPWYYGRSGFDMNVKNEAQGSFYEEGFAEFMASRYVRLLDGDVRPIGIDDEPRRELPSYFRQADLAMTCGPDGYAMELIGYGLDKRGTMSAGQFVELLLDTRKDETQVDALRAFARAVESLQPGLYTKLRKLNYGKETWREACDLVYEIATKET